MRPGRTENKVVRDRVDVIFEGFRDLQVKCVGEERTTKSFIRNL